MEKEKLAEICINRINRELKKGAPPLWYFGYMTGILDVLWDYDKKIWKEVVNKKIKDLIERKK